MMIDREDGFSNSEIDRLSLQLAALLDNLEQMQQKEKPYLLALYQTRLGELEYHLLNLQVECRALRRRIEQAVALLNRGEILTQQILSDIEAQVKRDLLVWQTQISDQAQMLAAGKAFFSELVVIDSSTQQRAKKAYRRLVRLLHPDVSPQHRELFDHYWQTVQDAYGNIDADLLEALQHIVETAASQCSHEADNHAETISRLNTLIASHSERLITLKTEVPFCWSEQLHDSEWLSTRKTTLDVAIAAETEHWAQLVSRHAKIVAQVS
jgi:hypothetical protein